MNFSIGRRHVGKPNPMFIIAEVGLAHDGSLGQAHAYIDAITRTGADCAKFQCHLGDPVSDWRVEPRFPQDRDRQAYWKRTGFTFRQWSELADHCNAVGLEFLCSPFSLDAVAFMDSLVNAWKVPSGKVADDDFIDAIGLTGKPVILSSGMSTLLEVNDAIYRLRNMGSEVALLQCTSMYPTPPSLVGLPIAAQWGGLSDHSGTIYPGIAAAALGCEVLEVHVCWSKDMGGLDTAASITTGQLAELVRGVRFVEAAMRPVDKDRVVAELSETRKVFMGVSA